MVRLSNVDIGVLVSMARDARANGVALDLDAAGTKTDHVERDRLRRAAFDNRAIAADLERAIERALRLKAEG